MWGRRHLKSLHSSPHASLDKDLPASRNYPTMALPIMTSLVLSDSGVARKCGVLFLRPIGTTPMLLRPVLQSRTRRSADGPAPTFFPFNDSGAVLATENAFRPVLYCQPRKCTATSTLPMRLEWNDGVLSFNYRASSPVHSAS